MGTLAFVYDGTNKFNKQLDQSLMNFYLIGGGMNVHITKIFSICTIDQIVWQLICQISIKYVAYIIKYFLHNFTVLNGIISSSGM